MRISDWSSDVCSSDLRDLSQRGGIEMADAALVERAQHQRMRIALHRIEHSAGKLADEAPGSAREHVGAQAVDGVARLQSTGNRGHVDRKSTRLNSSH